VALLYASKSLDAVKEKLENFDQTVGVQILQTALRVPLKTIADNAGELHLPVSFLVMRRQLCMCHCCFWLCVGRFACVIAFADKARSLLFHTYTHCCCILGCRGANSDAAVNIGAIESRVSMHA